MESFLFSFQIITGFVVQGHIYKFVKLALFSFLFSLF